MPSYHFSVQVIQRSKDRSAIAAAAYRAGTLLRDEQTGKSYDYSKRRGVVYSDIMIPEGTAPFLKDRQRLWAHAERLERREDAQLAREINLALPHELDAVQRQELLLSFVQEAFVNRGMVADVCIHEPVPGKSASPDNHHAHVMLPLRRATRGGLHNVKTREWNSREVLREWRSLWAAHQNRALSRAGLSVRVDHRTLVAQRVEALRRGDRVAAVLLDREPQVHLGRAARHAGKPLASKARKVGAPRKRGDAKPVRRVVDYPRIDQGQRAAFRARRIEAHRVRLKGKAVQWQARAARMRIRKVKLARREAFLQGELRRMMLRRPKHLPWRQNEVVAWDKAVRELLRKITEGERRRRLLDHLLFEMDRTLARMLAARAPERAPRTFTPMRVMPGRVRARHPIASASAIRDNGEPCGPG